MSAAWRELDLTPPPAPDPGDVMVPALWVGEVLATLRDALLELVESVDAVDSRLADIETKIAEVEPLLDMVRSRADRGAFWRNRRTPDPGGS